MAWRMPQRRRAGPQRQSVSKPFDKQVRRSQPPAGPTQRRRPRVSTVATNVCSHTVGDSANATYNGTRTLTPRVSTRGDTTLPEIPIPTSGTTPILGTSAPTVSLTELQPLSGTITFTTTNDLGMIWLSSSPPPSPLGPPPSSLVVTGPTTQAATTPASMRLGP